MNDNTIWTIEDEPRGETYKALVREAASCCSTALLVVRDGIPGKGRIDETLSKLAPFFIRESRETIWPGTELMTGTARILRYTLSEKCAAVLSATVHGLYDWQQPLLPEDLCTLRDDGRPWLVTISHERDAYLCLSEQEGKVIPTRIAGLRVHAEAS